MHICSDTGAAPVCSQYSSGPSAGERYMRHRVLWQQFVRYRVRRLQRLRKQWRYNHHCKTEKREIIAGRQKNMVMTTAKIDGMMCSMCESHVNEMIRKHFKVKKVTSSHKKNETCIVSENALTREELEAVLCTMGYHCLSVKSEPARKSRFGLFY